MGKHTTTEYNHERGFTIVELVVTSVVTSILAIALVALIVVWLQQFAIDATRNTMFTSTQAAIRSINDDIRRSTGVLTNNAAPDQNAPTPPGQWISSSTQLILAQTPRDSSGAGLYSSPGSYTGTPDSIVYYFQNNTLYRRIVPANYTGNINLPLQTCSAQTGGGCPSDKKLVGNVSSLSFTYLDANGNVAASPSSATAITITLQTQATTLGQIVQTTNSSTTTFR